MKTNLLQETLDFLKQYNKTPADVHWVGSGKAIGTWDEFAVFANFDYDDGYGGNEVDGSLVIVGDNWWLERGEYDGAEWWEFKTLPIKPNAPMQLRATDLKEHY